MTWSISGSGHSSGLSEADAKKMEDEVLAASKEFGKELNKLGCTYLSITTSDGQSHNLLSADEPTDAASAAAETPKAKTKEKP